MTTLAQIGDQMIVQAVVQRKIFCDITGEVLDVRSAVVLEDPDSGRNLGAMTGSTYDAMRAKAEEMGRPLFTRPVRVIDSREILGKTGKKA